MTKATHELKILPEFFDAVATGAKPFEVREDDRNFAVGDTLRLREWSPSLGGYTGRALARTITYKLPVGRCGIEPGYCVLGIGTREILPSAYVELEDLVYINRAEKARVYQLIKDLTEQNLAIKAEIGRLTLTVKFYADKENWKYNGGPGEPLAQRERGLLARATLGPEAPDGRQLALHLADQRAVRLKAAAPPFPYAELVKAEIRNHPVTEKPASWWRNFFLGM